MVVPNRIDFLPVEGQIGRLERLYGDFLQHDVEKKLYTFREAIDMHRKGFLMKRLLLILTVTIASIQLFEVAAEAGANRGCNRTRVKYQRHFTHPHRYHRYPPKYYDGFHARYFDTLGVPSGDVGLRGNGIYWMAW